MNQKEQLLSSFFDDALSSPDAKTLADFLENDPELSREFDDLHAIDRLLAVQFNPTTLVSIQAILEQIRTEQQPFVQSILQEISQEAVGGGSRRAADLINSCLRFFRSALRPALLCAAALVFIAAFIWLTPRQGLPQITSVQNTDFIAAGTTEPVPLKPGYQPRPGDRLLTHTNGSATISFGREATEITIAPGTDFRMTSLTQGKQFQLFTGKLEASVARQRPFRPMLVRTPQAEARVLGTRFVLTNGVSLTRLDVSEGTVRFRSLTDTPTVNVTREYYAIVGPGVELNSLPQTGSILIETWAGIPGSAYQDLLDSPRYPSNPTAREQIKLFDLAETQTNSVAHRIVGFVHPPVTGDYTFWIAGSEDAILSLSEEDPAEKTTIAGTSHSLPHQWEVASDGFQVFVSKSQSHRLIAGRRYFIEAIQKTNKGSSHLAVAWQIPGNDRAVISGDYLSPLIAVGRKSPR